MFLPLAQALPGLPRLRDIAGPLPVNTVPEPAISPSGWVLIAVGLLTLAALLTWFFTRDTSRPSQPEALLKARASLREAARLVPEDPSNELPSLLTRVIRSYLSETFGVTAVSITTDRLLSCLESADRLPSPLAAKAVAHIEECDRFKYLPGAPRPDSSERSRLHSATRDLLEELALANVDTRHHHHMARNQPATSLPSPGPATGVPPPLPPPLPPTTSSK